MSSIKWVLDWGVGVGIGGPDLGNSSIELSGYYISLAVVFWTDWLELLLKLYFNWI